MTLERIKAIKSVREEISELKRLEESLTSPLLPNYGEIPKVLEAFTAVTGESCAGSSWNAVGHRKKFVFVAAFIFAPGMLLGDSMPKRLRTALSNALGIKAMSAISNNWADALFYYRQYRAFREEIEEVTDKVISYLNVG